MLLKINSSFLGLLAGFSTLASYQGEYSGGDYNPFIFFHCAEEGQDEYEKDGFIVDDVDEEEDQDEEERADSDEERQKKKKRKKK